MELEKELERYEEHCLAKGNFLQSAYWPNVKANWGKEFITVEDDNGEIVGSMLILVKKIPVVGTAMLYCPHGPVCDLHNKEVLAKLMDKAKIIALKYHAYTLKVDPLIDETDHIGIENLKSLGFVWHPEKLGYDTVQCRENYMIDINGRTPDELLASFKPKWRYNIRLAQRKGLTCEFYGTEKLDEFDKMMERTAERDGFTRRGKAYFERMLTQMGGHAKLCMCYYEDKPLSGALCVDYGDTMSYVYGASCDEMRNFMPTYLMQWTMIKYAAEKGIRYYDFCGVPYWYNEEHRNYGVYRFKQGFNGYVKTWAGEFDYTFRPVMNTAASIGMWLHYLRHPRN